MGKKERRYWDAVAETRYRHEQASKAEFASKLQRLQATFTALDHPNVDAAAGIIRESIVMAEGPIKWDRGWADLATLQTTMDCINERFGDDGFPVIFNPQTFDHGPGGIAGAGKTLRIGDKEIDGVMKKALLCDTHILEHFPPREYLLELAVKQPKTLGLSIEYYPEPVSIDGRDYMRCMYFDGAAVVYAPAATPSLYSTRGSKKEVDTNKGEEQSRTTSNLLVFKKVSPLLTFKTK